MSLAGTLEDFSPMEVISVLGILEKSGKLYLNQGDDEGMVVFRRGKIIYAASSGFRENLGTMLLARGLVSEDELVEALAKQVAASEEKRLGAILIDMGAVSQGALDGVILEQVTRIIYGFSHWDSGQFAFTTVHVADHGEVELQAEDLWAPLGLSPNHVLLRLAQRKDEAARDASTAAVRPQPQSAPEPVAADIPVTPDPETQETGEAASLQDFVSELRGPQVKGELIQRLLEQARETFGRCVLFSARHDGFRSIAQTGEALPEPTDEIRLVEIALSRETPSILSRCAASGRTVMARLPEEEGDHQILDALGGPSDGKSAALPLSVKNETVLVLYGDRLLDRLHTGWLESLESFIDETARAIEADIQAEVTAEMSVLGPV